jgi:hypothetical protein
MAKKNYGILFYNHDGNKFKVYTNGVLQNKDFSADVKICCFPDEMVKIKIEFEDKSYVDGTIFMRKGYIEHTRVSKAGMEHDHYEHIPESLAEVTKPTVMEMEKPETVPARPPRTCSEPTSNVDFFHFYSHLKEHVGFDSERLKEAQDAVTGGCFTSKQVKITMSGFRYEETKLAFAKYAFNYVYDRDKYGMVKGGLDTDEAQKELDRYIHNW